MKEGDWVSLDGASGEIFKGRVQTVPAAIDTDLQTILGWADEVRTMKVRANADTPRDAKKAIEMGAEGIGLPEMVHWAEVHRDIIRRYGRFPHRNRILGRPSTPEELAFLEAGGFAG